MCCRKAGIIFLKLIFLPFLCVLAEDQLLFVNILYRHGDRTPVKPYPTDPYRNVSFWPTGFGQLTNKGKFQHYELGKWLRKRYSDFLPEKYSKNDIYVRSTDVDRTLMSAESNLAGLYAPVDSDVWNPNINWQPIPVHTLPETSDAVVSGKKKCPRFELELNKLLNDAIFKEIAEQLEPLFEYVSNYTGKKIDNLQDLEYLYNTLYIESLYNFQLPNWTIPVFPDKMLPWAHLSFEIYCYNPVLQRLKIGLLVNEILERFVSKTKGVLNPDRKIWIYSAHDTTVANLLMAFNAFVPHCPPYTSTILLELRHSHHEGYYIRAFYKNDTEAHPISILGCDLNCPLDKALTLLEPILIRPEQWEEECKNLSAPFISTIAAIAVVSCGILLLLLLVSLCIGAACSEQQHRNQFYQPLSDEIN